MTTLKQSYPLSQVYVTMSLKTNASPLAIECDPWSITAGTGQGSGTHSGRGVRYTFHRSSLHSQVESLVSSAVLASANLYPSSHVYSTPLRKVERWVFMATEMLYDIWSCPPGYHGRLKYSSLALEWNSYEVNVYCLLSESSSRNFHVSNIGSILGIA